MGDLSAAYNLIVSACNDPNIGYSQPNRTTIELGVSYRTYCDCSSLISWALTGAGYFNVNPWFYTGNEISYLLSAGWVEFDINTEWHAGDILWREGHTEMVYTPAGGSSGYTMGAHTDRYAFPDQVSINTSTSNASRYTRLFRDEGVIEPYPAVWTQTSEQRYYDLTEQRNNAICIYNFFASKGFTKESIAGIIGNLSWESTLNPNLWQNLTVGSGGYGLAQWTPASKYRDWATDKGYSFDDVNQNGNGQLLYINDQTTGEWLPSSTHPEYRYTWEEFSHISDIDVAVYAFLYQYERAGAEKIQERLELAHYWYDQFGSFPSDPGAEDILWLLGAIQNMKNRKLLT